MRTLGEVNLSSYLPLMVIVLMAATFAAINIVGTMLIGPKRSASCCASCKSRAPLAKIVFRGWAKPR